MAEAAIKTAEPAAQAERALTDGFQLVIDALKLNGINTIYGVPGIPITDLGRMAQAAGMRMHDPQNSQTLIVLPHNAAGKRLTQCVEANMRRAGADLDAGG